jgi:hypothetical protein
MPTSSYKFAGTAASSAGGGAIDWHNDEFGTALSSNRLSANDNNYAVSLQSSGADSYWLLATNYGDTTADVPSGATVDGFEFRHQRFRNTGTVTIVQTQVKLVKGGAVSGSDFGDSADWATSEETKVYGGASQLGGLSWTDAEARASDSGVAVKVTWGTVRLDTGGANVDSIERRVHYTAAAGTKGVTPWRRPMRIFKQRF